MSPECPNPPDHESFDALAPSRLPGNAATDPDSAGSAMQGFEPAGERSGPVQDTQRNLGNQMELLVTPAPGHQ